MSKINHFKISIQGELDQIVIGYPQLFNLLSKYVSSGASISTLYSKSYPISIGKCTIMKIMSVSNPHLNEIRKSPRSRYYQTKEWVRDGKIHNHSNKMLVYLPSSKKSKATNLKNNSYAVEWNLDEDRNVFRNLKWQSVSSLLRVLRINGLDASKGTKEELVQRLMKL